MDSGSVRHKGDGADDGNALSAAPPERPAPPTVPEDGLDQCWCVTPAKVPMRIQFTWSEQLGQLGNTWPA